MKTTIKTKPETLVINRLGSESRQDTEVELYEMFCDIEADGIALEMFVSLKYCESGIYVSGDYDSPGYVTNEERWIEIEYHNFTDFDGYEFDREELGLTEKELEDIVEELFTPQL